MYLTNWSLANQPFAVLIHSVKLECFSNSDSDKFIVLFKLQLAVDIVLNRLSEAFK